jgi:hypothetical protein
MDGFRWVLTGNGRGGTEWIWSGDPVGRWRWALVSDGRGGTVFVWTNTPGARNG